MKTKARLLEPMIHTILSSNLMSSPRSMEITDNKWCSVGQGQYSISGRVSWTWTEIRSNKVTKQVRTPFYINTAKVLAMVQAKAIMIKQLILELIVF